MRIGGKRLSRLAPCVWLFASIVSGCGSSVDPELRELLRQFRDEEVSWKQSAIRDRIVERGDPNALPALESWLEHEDRSVGGNVAFIFAKLGDERGLDTIIEILADRSALRRIDSPPFISILGGPDDFRSPEDMLAAYRRSPGALPAQIKRDRYFAVHLLGRLQDPRAVDVLVPLMEDNDVNYNVAWALAEIGDERAIATLISALRHADALVRVSAIKALEKLRAEEALPHLETLFTDPAPPSAGDRIAVGTTAKAAVEALRREP